MVEPVGAGVDSRGLGRVVQVSDIRTVWPHEAADFTPWIFENLDVLADAIGVPLTPVVMEHPVGPFRLDVLATEADGRKVAIENQVEQADHAHLGQLVLYAAHVEASTAVWISPRFRDEQRQALLWLNEKTVDGVRFFGVEVGVVRIGSSAPAPVFNVVVRPNDLQKADSRAGSDGSAGAALSERRAFLDDVMRGVASRVAGFRVPTGESWSSYIWFRSGPFGYFCLAFVRDRRLRVEAYLDLGDAERTLRLFDEMSAQREAVEEALGYPLSWERLEGARASRIAVYRDFTLPGGESDAEEATLWATDRIVGMLAVLEPRLRTAAADVRKS